MATVRVSPGDWTALILFQVLASLDLATAGTTLLATVGARGPTSESPLGLPQHVVQQQAAVYALAFGRGDSLASGSRDHDIAIWNLTRGHGLAEQTRRPSRVLAGHTGGITALTFAERPRGLQGGPSEVLISGAADNTTRIWDSDKGEELAILRHPKTVFGVAVAPQRDSIDKEEDGQEKPERKDKEYGELATACWDGVVRLFSLIAGIQKAELTGHTGGLYAVAYSPLDGSLLASASADRTVRIWNVKDHKLLWTLQGHKDHVTTVDWSPLDPLTLATGSWDRKFHLWEISSDEAKACRSALANCSATVKPRSSGKHPQLVWKVAFAPGGEEVAACHGAFFQSPTVVVYDVRSGTVVRRLGRHKDTPLVVVWSRDGSWLASAGMDKQVLVYDGHSMLNDLPQGDVDDRDEKSQWLQDLEDFRMGRSQQNNTNATGDTAAENSTEAEPTVRLPHPLGGRVAYY